MRWRFAVTCVALAAALVWAACTTGGAGAADEPKTAPTDQNAAPTVAAAPNPPPANDQPPARVFRVYDVGDLLRVPPDLYADPWAPRTPVQVRGSALGGLYSVPPSAPPDRWDPGATNNLYQNISALVGTDGSTTSSENMLMVDAPHDVQAKVAQTIAAMIKNREENKTVTVHASWLLLDPAELKSICSADGGNTVAVEALQKLPPERLFARAVISCLGGQTVHITSGRVRTFVERVQANSGGIGEEAYQPWVDELLSGAILQVTPHIANDMATMDVMSRIGMWDNTPPPIVVHQLVRANFSATRPTDVPFGVDSEATASIDRMDAPSQELATTVRAKLGATVVAGGMTLDPGESHGPTTRQASDAAPATRPATTRPGQPGTGRLLFLILRVDAK